MNKPSLHILKVGGKILEDEILLQHFLEQLGAIPQPFILVHGGGTTATRLAQKLEIPLEMLDGRRITDPETLKVAVMVYAGWINKNLVARLQAKNIPCLGLCGADLNLLPAKKRNPHPVNYGLVGDPVPGIQQQRQIQQLLNSGISLIFSAITHDEHGQLLNTNADSLAGALATLLTEIYEVQLLLLLEQKGVLKEGQVMREISLASIPELQTKGIVHSGMIPKLTYAAAATQSGAKVSIGHALEIAQLLTAQAGTQIVMT